MALSVSLKYVVLSASLNYVGIMCDGTSYSF